MMAPLSDRQRWGISAGVSLGHQRRASLGHRQKSGFFAGRVTIAARQSRRGLRPDADPAAAASIHCAGAARLAYR